jgi:hypothetical protein
MKELHYKVQGQEVKKANVRSKQWAVSSAVSSKQWAAVNAEQSAVGG